MPEPLVFPSPAELRAVSGDTNLAGRAHAAMVSGQGSFPTSNGLRRYGVDRGGATDVEVTRLDKDLGADWVVSVRALPGNREQVVITENDPERLADLEKRQAEADERDNGIKRDLNGCHAKLEEATRAYKDAVAEMGRLRREISQYNKDRQ